MSAATQDPPAPTSPETPSAQATRFAWSADRDPDWWLTLIAAEMRTASKLARSGQTMIAVAGRTDPVRVWDWLHQRIMYLMSLADTAESNK